MRLIEDWGWIHHWVVERYNQFSGQKSDLFNIIDLLAVTPKGTIGVQSCGADWQPHKRKIMEEEMYFTKVWLRTPKTQLWVIGWRKLRVPNTKKQTKFYPRIAQVKYSRKKDSLTFHEHPLVK